MSYHDKTLPTGALRAVMEHLRTKDAGDPIDMLAQRFGDLTDVMLKRLEATETQVKGMGGQMDRLDMRMSRPAGLGMGADPFADEGGKSWGRQFAENPNLKGFAEERARPTRLRMEMKTTITTGATSGGPMGVPTRDLATILPRRRMTIRDLLPKVNVSSNTVEYPAQTTRPGAAATVAEGALKPESALAFSLVTTPTQVIAHWLPASVQILSDAPQLADTIDGELRYGLMLAEEAQLLNGNGTSPNIRGLIPQATLHVDPLTLGTPTLIDRVGSAILQTALADFEADGVVMHPADWMRIRLMKDAEGKYLLGDPQTAVAPNLFGVPVVTTQAIAVDKFLVGNFAAAATLYDRWEARVEVSTEHADFFVRNLIAIRAEERIGLAVKQPLALTYGDFGNVA